MYIFKFADIGEGIHEGKVSDILVKVGDTVKDGTDLFSVETDKITTEVASPVNGVITKIMCNVGDTIHVGDALFEIDDGSGGSSAPAVAETKAEPKVEESSGGASVVGEVKVSNDVLPLFGAAKAAAPVAATTQSGYVNENVLASPVARVLAKDNNVSLKTIKGTGENGRITKNDVLNAMSGGSVVSATTSTASKPAAEPAKPIQASEADQKIAMSSMRKAIANAMVRSWSSVAYTNLSIEIDVTDLWDERNRIKDFILEKENVKLNLLPFIVKALAKTLKKFPMFNALIDDASNSLVLKGQVNIGIAVDTKDGLIVPNVKNADKLSVLEIAKTISEIATKARNKKIGMADITNGTFSVTNYGSLGVDFGVPVINYPEVAIAGLGTMSNKIKKIGMQMVERKVMYITIAADHRWVDGGDIARFAKQVKEYLENITLLFI